MTRRRRDIAALDVEDPGLRTAHAFAALKDLLGAELYELARVRAQAANRAPSWMGWLPEMWQVADEHGLRERALVAADEANAKHALLRCRACEKVGEWLPGARHVCGNQACELYGQDGSMRVHTRGQLRWRPDEPPAAA